jgi:hypothetical protein
MFQALFNTFFGCSHQHTTFPQTPHRSTPHLQAPGAPRSGTYVVCLDCGKEFAYDWEGMRLGVTLPNKTERFAPVADGRFDGLPPHVA